MTINLFAPCTNRLGYEARLFIRFGDEWIKTTPQDNGTLVTAEVPALTETFECAVVVAQPGAAIPRDVFITTRQRVCRLVNGEWVDFDPPIYQNTWTTQTRLARPDEILEIEKQL